MLYCDNSSQILLIWKKIKTRKYIFTLLICVLIASCSQKTSKTIPTPNQTIIPQSPFPQIISVSPSQSPPPIPSESPTPSTSKVWLTKYLPDQMRINFTLPNGYSLATIPEMADVTLELSEQNDQHSIQWVYALVAPFPTITDGISSEELQSAWIGNPVSSFADVPLLMDESTLNVLTALWGSPEFEICIRTCIGRNP